MWGWREDGDAGGKEEEAVGERARCSLATPRWQWGTHHCQRADKLSIYRSSLMIHVFDRLIKRSQRQLHNRLMRNLSSYCTHRYFGCLLTSRLWEKCKYSSFTLISVTIRERTKCAQLAFGLVALQYLGIFQKSNYRGIQNHYITAARKYFIVHIIYLLLLLFPICKNKGT